MTAMRIEIDNCDRNKIRIELDINELIAFIQQNQRSRIVTLVSSSSHALQLEDLISNEESEYWRSSHIWGL